MPDSIVSDTDLGPMVRELHRRSLFFTFVNRAIGRNGTDSSLTMTDSLFRGFRRFLDEEKFTYQEEGEAELEHLRDAARKGVFSPEVIEEIDRLDAAIDHDKALAFDRYRQPLYETLRIELQARLRGMSGRIEASFNSDAQMRAAVGLLNNPLVYAAKIKGDGI